jgi:hypothetical protein
LVFEPYKTNQPIGGVLQNVWQTWDTLATNSAWRATAEPGSRYCAEESPCTWAQILKLFPRAAIATEGGQVWLRAGNWWGRAVTASADALVIGVEGAQTRYDFEPETPCKETCYVDGVLGNDAFGGDTPASAKRTIQAALAQAAPGGEVIVRRWNVQRGVDPDEAGDAARPQSRRVPTRPGVDLPTQPGAAG